MIPYQILLLNEYYSIPFSLYPYHMNQKEFKRDKLYYKTIGLIMHDRHVIESSKGSKRDIKTAI